MTELTAVQNFALEMLFRSLGEKQGAASFDNMLRKMDRIPKSLKQVHYLVNDELGRYALTKEFRLREFCRFKAGDKVIRYERYPTSISKETIRQALRISGWWPRREKMDWLKSLNSRPCQSLFDWAGL
jgi:hypothetical protein